MRHFVLLVAATLALLLCQSADSVAAQYCGKLSLGFSNPSADLPWEDDEQEVVPGQAAPNPRRCSATAPLSCANVPTCYENGVFGLSAPDIECPLYIITSTDFSGFKYCIADATSTECCKSHTKTVEMTYYQCGWPRIEIGPPEVFGAPTCTAINQQNRVFTYYKDAGVPCTEGECEDGGGGEG